MSRDTCRYPTCDNEPGQQDREDYNATRYCSIQCQTKYEHIKADAKDAERQEPTRERGQDMARYEARSLNR